MVKFVSLSLVMAAIASMSVMAQDDPEASSSVSSTGSASATQAPSSTGAPAASSTMTSASSSSAAGGDNDSDSNNTASGVSCSFAKQEGSQTSLQTSDFDRLSPISSSLSITHLLFYFSKGLLNLGWRSICWTKQMYLLIHLHSSIRS